jgi:hypothetical protein
VKAGADALPLNIRSSRPFGCWLKIEADPSFCPLPGPDRQRRAWLALLLERKKRGYIIVIFFDDLLHFCRCQPDASSPTKNRIFLKININRFSPPDGTPVAH